MLLIDDSVRVSMERGLVMEGKESKQSASAGDAKRVEDLDLDAGDADAIKAGFNPQPEPPGKPPPPSQHS